VGGLGGGGFVVRVGVGGGGGVGGGVGQLGLGGVGVRFPFQKFSKIGKVQKYVGGGVFL